MRNRRLFVVTLAVAGALFSVIGWRTRHTTAQQLSRRSVDPSVREAKQAASPLPVTQVILFNSGVAYFQRQGEVDESTRVDLSFPANDINDLLKSLVLQDLDGGTITAISYDSHDPIDKTLKSFALDLTANPTLGQLLNQARGEKVEVMMQPTYNPQPGLLTGTIVGMESQLQTGTKGGAVVHLLNLRCSDGLRSLPLSEVQRVRFTNATLDGEFTRALDVLASTHDTQKKMVSLGFSGKGKRSVRVGYVVENPIWKTNYRLVLNQKDKALLQGWAVVENTSDDDWNGVRMVLVSGRPISFQMDLYQPLYIPRPTVEPELFASLRPPTYSGALTNPNAANETTPSVTQSPVGLAGGAPALGNFQGGPAAFNPFFNAYQMNGQWGNLSGQAGNLGGQLGQQGGQLGLITNNGLNEQNYRLTYEELQKRRQQQQAAKGQAKAVGGYLTAIDPGKSIASVAAAEEIGDYFQYAIDHPVSLPRQKSALLPIVSNQPVEAAKVSIFNEGVHAKFPLLGLRFKNTSGQNLTQGPVTVYEGGNYQGDARILDLQPNEERLLSYAIDLGTEVKVEQRSSPQQLTAVKVSKGMLLATHKLRDTKTYLVKNRSGHDRTLLIEHPIRQDWTLVKPEKPNERSRDVYRFQLQLPAGETIRQEVVEEQSLLSRIALLNSDDQTLRVFLNSKVSSAALKEALKKAMDLRARLTDTQRELAQLEGQLKGITEDQERLRANFRTLPSNSAAYKRYLEKFDTQETEIEKLQTQIKQARESEKQHKKAYEDYLTGLVVE